MTYRNKKLLEIVRKLPCQICGIEDGTVIAAHSNQQRDGKGTGIKSADYRIVALCNLCHMGLDQGRAMSKTERMELWEDAHRRTIGALFEQGFLNVK